MTTPTSTPARRRLAPLGELAPADSLGVRDLVHGTGIPDLLSVLICPDAARAYAGAGSLRRLLALRDLDALALDLTTATRLAALRELVERLAAEARPMGQAITHPTQAARAFGEMALLDHEEFHALFLTIKHTVIAHERIAIGRTASVEFDPPDLFRPAIARGAAALLVAHNHPSGDPTPSETDRALTVGINHAARVLGIPILDHLVIGDRRRAYSFTEKTTFSF
jgi:DNA repair protein RadC